MFLLSVVMSWKPLMSSKIPSSYKTQKILNLFYLYGHSSLSIMRATQRYNMLSIAISIKDIANYQCPSYRGYEKDSHHIDSKYNCNYPPKGTAKAVPDGVHLTVFPFYM